MAGRAKKTWRRGLREGKGCKTSSEVNSSGVSTVQKKGRRGGGEGVLEGDKAKLCYRSAYVSRGAGNREGRRSRKGCSKNGRLCDLVEVVERRMEAVRKRGGE